MQEVDQSGRTQTSYIYGLDLVSKVNEKNKADYYLYDGLGSVIGLTNQQGALTIKYSYDEFGIPGSESKFDNRAYHENVYGFTGEQWDNSNQKICFKKQMATVKTIR
ncbi:MAG TPA: hypothetical protein HA348_07725 [Thermoplasmata archaeon]|nr:hypothetical protein [Thermoplasmata archaeon]